MTKQYGGALFAILLTLTLNAQNPGDPEPREVPTEARGGVTTLAVTNVIPKYVDGSGTLGDSIIADSGSAIGIGTTNPGARLDVREAASTNMLMRVWNTGTGGATMRYVAADGAAAQMQLTHHFSWTAAIAATIADGIQFRVCPPGIGSGSETVLNNSTRMTITRAGNVGIGTLAPTANLHVTGGPTPMRIIGSSASGVVFQDIGVTYPGNDGLLMAMQGNSAIEVSDLQIGSLGNPVLRSKTGNLLLSAPANRDVIIGDAGAATKFVFAAAGTSSFGGAMTVNGDVVVGSAGQPTRLIVAGGGTSAFSGPVTINGGLQVNGDITGTRVLNAVYRDVAEWVDSDQKLGDGTVVIVAPDKADQVVASSGSYDSRVAGVVSAQPGVLLGIPGEAKVKVATTGRVKVKVDASVHPIAIGDLLVSSTKAGVAMKSIPLDLGGVPIHRPGTLIGKALEPLAGGEGEILVLLSLQ